MSKEPNPIGDSTVDDIILLLQFAKISLMIETNFFDNLTTYLNNNPNTRPYIEYYGTVSRLLGTASEGPGFTNIFIQFFAFHIILSINEIRTKENLIKVDTTASLQLLKKFDQEYFPNIIKNLEKINDTLEGFTRIFADIAQNIDFIRSRIDGFVSLFQQFSELVFGRFNRLEDRIVEYRDQTRRRIDTAQTTIINTLREIINQLENRIFSRIDSTTSSIKTVLETNFTTLYGLWDALTASIAALAETLTIISNTVAALSAGLASGFGALITNVERLLSGQNSILDKIKQLPLKVETRIKDSLVPFLPIFAQQVADFVSICIVGTSYYKWDSENSYYPTLVFLFAEEGIDSQKRHTQIKAKLPYRTEDLPQDIVSVLRKRIQSVGTFKYIRGNVRANFVHPDKKWKTTFFVKNRTFARNLLNYISKILGIAPAYEGLSYTEGRQPSTHTRLIKDLDEIKYRRNFIEGEYSISLFRIVLLVNNANNPVIIWQKEE